MKLRQAHVPEKDALTSEAIQHGCTMVGAEVEAIAETTEMSNDSTGFSESESAEVVPNDSHPALADPSVGRALEILKKYWTNIEDILELSTPRGPLTSSSVTTRASGNKDAARLGIEELKDNPGLLNYYTGLEDYETFKFVLATLRPAAGNLKFRKKRSRQLSVENQFLLIFIKLRKARENVELAAVFCITVMDVANIYVTWINFMNLQWKEIDIFPDKALIKYYMPSDTKKKFGSVGLRMYLDGTEIKIPKPTTPGAQQATFSTYKNTNTMKVLTGATPGGLVSFIGKAYGGSTSDRQLFERCTILQKCEPKDVILAYKGFDVQDLAATRDVIINIPTFFRGVNQLEPAAVQRGRKISSKRVHIERLIGYAETYEILHQIPFELTELSNQIVFVVFMLCNFRRCIIPPDTW